MAPTAPCRVRVLWPTDGSVGKLGPMQHVEVRRDGAVTTVTLADEANRNALGAGLVAELLDAFGAADADASTRVVVVANAGPVFCAGADLRDPAPGEEAARLFAHAARSAKPYVGRIGGHCVAGGIGLAAGLDVTVADADARFGFTEVRVGVAPAMIAVVCLPRLRRGDARELMLRGRRFSGADAARLGLVDRAVPAEDLDGAVAAVVDDLLAAGPRALAATKQVLAEVPGLPVDAAFAWARELSAELFAGEEAVEGRAAFLEKRPPAWTVATP